MPEETLQDLPPFTLGKSTLLLDSPVFNESDELKQNESHNPGSGLYTKLKETCRPENRTVPKPQAQEGEQKPSFGFSVDGPVLGEVTRAEPSLGQRMLNQLNTAVLTNAMDATAAREMASLVESWQTRLDLAGVGIAAYSVSRIQSVTQMAEDVERHIWERISELPLMEAINLLKILHKDRLSFMSLLGSRATTPTISSPEALSSGLSGKAEEASKPRVSVVKPEGRKRLHSIMSKLRKTLDDPSLIVEVPLDGGDSVG